MSRGKARVGSTRDAGMAEVYGDREEGPLLLLLLLLPAAAADNEDDDGDPEDVVVLGL